MTAPPRSVRRLLFGKQRHRAWCAVTFFEDLDRLLPDRLLMVVDLTKIKDVPLNDLATSDTLVLDEIQ